MSDEWFYLNDGEQLGPYFGEQLQGLVAAGTIQRTTLLWTEGMPEWLPAEQIENLFPTETAEASEVSEPVAQVQVSAATPITNSPYQTPQTAVGAMHSTPIEGPFPNIPIKKASFLLHIGLGLIVPAVLGIILFIATLAVGASEASTPGEELSDNAAAGLGFGIIAGFGLIYLSVIASSIIGMMHLYRAWKVLQPAMPLPRTTPGKAVGFLLIPLFNLYWIFIAYQGFAEDWNRTMDSYEDTRAAPRMQSGTFLTYAIITIVASFLAPIFYYMAHKQICDGINFMANRNQPGGMAIKGMIASPNRY